MTDEQWLDAHCAQTQGQRASLQMQMAAENAELLRAHAQQAQQAATHQMRCTHNCAIDYQTKFQDERIRASKLADQLQPKDDLIRRLKADNHDLLREVERLRRKAR
jgi:hypothetical protein